MIPLSGSGTRALNCSVTSKSVHPSFLLQDGHGVAFSLSLSLCTFSTPLVNVSPSELCFFTIKGFLIKMLRDSSLQSDFLVQKALNADYMSQFSTFFTLPFIRQAWFYPPSFYSYNNNLVR